MFQDHDVGLIFQQDEDDGQWVAGFCDLKYVGDVDR